MEHIKRVMVVDDNIIDQMITTRILKTHYEYDEIMIVHSAVEALEYIDRHLDNLALLPNLILLDLDMPLMNGFGFLERFNKYCNVIKSKCAIVVLTASDVKNDLEKIKFHPQVSKLIAKPLNKSSLYQIT